jgi:hypothetical protein
MKKPPAGRPAGGFVFAPPGAPRAGRKDHSSR